MKPVILVVLDGWGIGQNSAVDATAKAEIPFLPQSVEGICSFVY